MFVTVVKSQQNVEYVQVRESYRMNGKKRSRVVEKLGRLDALLAEDPDALTKLKAKYAKMSQEQIAAKRAARVENLLNGVNLEVPAPELQAGHYPLKAVWEDDLQIDRKLARLQKMVALPFSLKHAVSFMAIQRLLAPTHSLAQMVADRNHWLGNPAGAVADADLAAALRSLANYKTAMLDWLNHHLQEDEPAYGADRLIVDLRAMPLRELPAVPDMADTLQAQFHRFREEQRLGVRCFDYHGQPLPGEFPQKFWTPFLKVTKESTKASSQCFTALFLNQKGLPVDYTESDCQAGSVQEALTLIDQLEQAHPYHRLLVVGRTPLSVPSTIETIVRKKQMGCLVSLPVMSLTPEVQEKLLNKRSYRAIPHQPASPVALSSWDESLYPRVPSYQFIKGYTLGNVKGELVVTFSPEWREQDLNLMSVFLARTEDEDLSSMPLMAPILDAEQQIDDEKARRMMALAGCRVAFYHPGAKIDADFVNEERRQLPALLCRLSSVGDLWAQLKGHDLATSKDSAGAQEQEGLRCLDLLSVVTLLRLQERLAARSVDMSLRDILKGLQSVTLLARGTSSKLIFENCNAKEGTLQGKSFDELRTWFEKHGYDREDYAALVFAAIGMTYPERLTDVPKLGRYLRTRFVDGVITDEVSAQLDAQVA